MGYLSRFVIISLGLIFATPFGVHSVSSAEPEGEVLAQRQAVGSRGDHSRGFGSGTQAIKVSEGKEGNLKLNIPTSSLETGFYIIFPNNPQKSCSPNVSCPNGESPNCSGTQNACVCKCEGGGGGGGSGGSGTVSLNVNVTNN